MKFEYHTDKGLNGGAAADVEIIRDICTLAFILHYCDTCHLYDISALCDV